jgi:hypothetical protein|tara:strand:- start:1716 stop:1955 length:240 start_codon:yes stop_codon:yes gene_type:complete
MTENIKTTANMLQPTPPEFDWAALLPENVEPAIRGTVGMLDHCLFSQPLELDYMQLLVTRLQDGLQRAVEIRESLNEAL